MPFAARLAQGVRLVANTYHLDDQRRHREDFLFVDRAWDCFLGWMLSNDKSAKNQSEGVRWLRKAADRGNTDAQMTLGRQLRDGQGVAKDPAEAFAWMHVAALNAKTPSNRTAWLKERDAIGDELPAAEKAKAAARARQYAKQFAPAQ